MINITTQKNNHLKEGKNTIGISVIYFPLSVITDFTWTGWETANETTTFQEKGSKWMNKSQRRFVLAKKVVNIKRCMVLQ